MENERLSTPEEIKEMLAEMAADGNIEAIQDGYRMFFNGSRYTTTAFYQGGQFHFKHTKGGPERQAFDTADELKAAMAEIAAPAEWNVEEE